MNREIKFKRYHFDENENVLSITEWGFIDKKYPKTFTSPSRLSNEYIVEDVQYTGLNDVNGKEIYEGDILKIEHYHKVNLQTGKKTEQYSQKTIKILFERGSFCYSIIDQENSYFGNIPSAPLSLFTLAIEKYTTIGNIYENKELLNND